MRLLSLLLLLAGVSCAQVKTGTSMNGRFWDQLSLDGKMGYVVGAADAIFEFGFHVRKDCACAADVVIESMRALYGQKGDALYVESVQAIDAFYKESANKRITVIGAMKYVAKMMDGATKQELEEYEAALRRSSQ